MSCLLFVSWRLAELRRMVVVRVVFLGFDNPLESAPRMTEEDRKWMEEAKKEAMTGLEEGGCVCVVPVGVAGPTHTHAQHPDRSGAC